MCMTKILKTHNKPTERNIRGGIFSGYKVAHRYDMSNRQIKDMVIGEWYEATDFINMEGYGLGEPLGGPHTPGSTGFHVLPSLDDAEKLRRLMYAPMYRVVPVEAAHMLDEGLGCGYAGADDIRVITFQFMRYLRPV